MRPGQAAPEFAIPGQPKQPKGNASMRPGQAAPEFDLLSETGAPTIGGLQ